MLFKNSRYRAYQKYTEVCKGNKGNNLPLETNYTGNILWSTLKTSQRDKLMLVGTWLSCLGECESKYKEVILHSNEKFLKTNPNGITFTLEGEYSLVLNTLFIRGTITGTFEEMHINEALNGMDEIYNYLDYLYKKLVLQD